jgi:hypothetical protein
MRMASSYIAGGGLTTPLGRRTGEGCLRHPAKRIEAHSLGELRGGPALRYALRLRHSAPSPASPAPNRASVAGCGTFPAGPPTESSLNRIQ